MSADSDAGSPRTRPNCVRCRNHNVKSPLRGHKLYCDFRSCRCEKCRQTVDRQKMMAEQIAHRRRKAQDAERQKNGLPLTPSSAASPGPDDRTGGHPDEPDSISLRWEPQSDDYKMEKHVVSSATSGIYSNCSSNSTLYPASSAGSDVSVTGVSVISSPGNNSRPISHNSSNDVINSNSNSSCTSNKNIISFVDSAVSSSRQKSKEPVKLESVLKLSEMLMYNQVDTHTLLFMILKEVTSDVDEAHRRIVKGPTTCYENCYLISCF